MNKKALIAILAAILLGLSGCMSEEKVREIGERGEVQKLIEIYQNFDYSVPIRKLALEYLLKHPDDKRVKKLIKKNIETKAPLLPKILVKKEILDRWKGTIIRWGLDEKLAIPGEIARYLMNRYRREVRAAVLKKCSKTSFLQRANCLLKYSWIKLDKKLFSEIARELLSTDRELTLKELKDLAEAVDKVSSKLTDTDSKKLSQIIGKNLQEKSKNSIQKGCLELEFESLGKICKKLNSFDQYILKIIRKSLESCLDNIPKNREDISIKKLESISYCSLGRSDEKFGRFLGEFTAKSIEKIIKSKSLGPLKTTVPLAWSLKYSKTRGRIRRLLGYTLYKRNYIKRCFRISKYQLTSTIKSSEPEISNAIDLSRKFLGLDEKVYKKLLRLIREVEGSLEFAEKDVTSAQEELYKAERKLEKAKELKRKFIYLRGYIVGSLGFQTYEVSLFWRGRAILETTNTMFTTTGWFGLWVKRDGVMDVKTKYGTVVTWPVYKEVSSSAATLAYLLYRSSLRKVREAKRRLYRAERYLKRFARDYCRKFNRALLKVRNQIAYRAKYL